MNLGAGSSGLQDLLAKLPEFMVTYGMKLVMAIIIFVIGKWLVKIIAGLLGKAMSTRGVDLTVATFVKNIVYYALFVMVIIAALGQLGIQTASFVAIIGAAGLAVGFALQGSLANFASGVLLILFRPFKVGDFVEAGGSAGVVSEISIFSTILKSGDNKTIIISNSAVMGGNITNYSTETQRRVDITVGISYSADIDITKRALQKIAESESNIIIDKGVTIAVSELADSSVNFVFRVWVETANYWPVLFSLNEKIKVQFDQQGIEIPFPQMDLHIKPSGAVLAAK